MELSISVIPSPVENYLKNDLEIEFPKLENINKITEVTLPSVSASSLLPIRPATHSGFLLTGLEKMGCEIISPGFNYTNIQPGHFTKVNLGDIGLYFLSDPGGTNSSKSDTAREIAVKVGNEFSFPIGTNFSDFSTVVFSNRLLDFFGIPVAKMIMTHNPLEHERLNKIIGSEITVALIMEKLKAKSLDELTSNDLEKIKHSENFFSQMGKLIAIDGFLDNFADRANPQAIFINFANFMVDHDLTTIYAIDNNCDFEDEEIESNSLDSFLTLTLNKEWFEKIKKKLPDIQQHKLPFFKGIENGINTLLDKLTITENGKRQTNEVVINELMKGYPKIGIDKILDHSRAQKVKENFLIRCSRLIHYFPNETKFDLKSTIKSKKK